MLVDTQVYCDLSAAPKITLTNFKAVGANSVVGVTFAAVNPVAGIENYRQLLFYVILIFIHYLRYIHNINH